MTLRWPALAAALATVAAPAAALDALPGEEDVVAIRGFELRSLANLDAGPGRIDLHPKAMLGALWESNPRSSPGQGAADTALRATAGLELRTWLGDRTTLGADAVFDAVRYRRTSEKSVTGGEAGLAARTIGEDWSSEVRVRWRRDAEPLSPLPEQVRRDRLEGRVSVAAESRDWRGDLSASLSRLDYLEAAPTFGADQRDTGTAAATAGLHRLAARGSMIGVLADAAAIDRNADGDAWQTGLLGHWQHPLGERSGLDLRAGAALRGHGGGTTAAAAGRIGLSWSWESGSWLIARLERSLQDGTIGRSDASVLAAAVVESRLRLLDRLGCRLSLWAARREDSSAPDGAQRLQVRSLMLRGGPEYQLRDGLGLRAWAMYASSDPSIGAGSTAWTAAVELGLAL